MLIPLASSVLPVIWSPAAMSRATASIRPCHPPPGPLGRPLSPVLLLSPIIDVLLSPGNLPFHPFRGWARGVGQGVES